MNVLDDIFECHWSIHVAIITPWFLIAVGGITIVYYDLSLYYWASARELKQLDAILKFSLYAHFSELLTGLATIWAYSETEWFKKESEDRVNIENRFACLSNKSQKIY